MGERILDKACRYLRRKDRRRLRRLLGTHEYLKSGVYGHHLLESSRAHLDMLRWLLRFGVSVDSCGNDGCTALITAAAEGELDRIAVLLEHGADVDVRNQPAGETPFSYACAYNQLEAAKLLYERGADINTTYNDWAGTPMDTALCHASQEFRDWLFSIGARRGLDFAPWPAPGDDNATER